jgi:hypothetical protein
MTIKYEDALGIVPGILSGLSLRGRPFFGLNPFDVVSGFSPLDLFQSGEQGAWYDPSDLTTLFQDDAGTTPVVSDGDPVGLMQDKSGNGNDATQSVSARRPTYRTDGTLHWLEFDGVDDYMSFSYSGGATDITLSVGAEITSVTGNQVFISDSVTFDLGLYASGADAVFYKRNPLASAVGVSAISAATPFVQTGVIDLGNTLATRVDGVETSVSVDGARDDVSSFYMGRDASSGYMGGKIYSSVVVQNALADLTDLEAHIAEKSGVTL